MPADLRVVRNCTVCGGHGIQIGVSDGSALTEAVVAMGGLTWRPCPSPTCDVPEKERQRALAEYRRSVNPSGRFA